MWPSETSKVLNNRLCKSDSQSICPFSSKSGRNANSIHNFVQPPAIWFSTVLLRLSISHSELQWSGCLCRFCSPLVSRGVEGTQRKAKNQISKKKKKKNKEKAAFQKLIVFKLLTCQDSTSVTTLCLRPRSCLKSQRSLASWKNFSYKKYIRAKKESGLGGNKEEKKKKKFRACQANALKWLSGRRGIVKQETRWRAAGTWGCVNRL